MHIYVHAKKRLPDLSLQDPKSKIFLEHEMKELLKAFAISTNTTIRRCDDLAMSQINDGHEENNKEVSQLGQSVNYLEKKIVQLWSDEIKEKHYERESATNTRKLQVNTEEGEHQKTTPQKTTALLECLQINLQRSKNAWMKLVKRIVDNPAENVLK